ncbi:MAG TPA: hypothetical protein VN635_02675 [Conexibacter sp.]|nr:hypothetical protein [Conexibacter sp.]
MRSSRLVMWQFGHVAETMSRSSEISVPPDLLAGGYDSSPPDSLTFLKHPLALVQGGKP